MNGNEDMKDPGPVREVNNDQRELIGTYMAFASIATDPGHIYVMTSSFYTAVVGGLVAKYGMSLRGLTDDILLLVSDDFSYVNDKNQPSWNQGVMAYFNDTDMEVPTENIPYQIETAAAMLNASASFWGRAIPMLHRAQKSLSSICVVEDMLNYKSMTVSLQEEMDRIQSIRESNSEDDDKERPFGR